MSRRISLVILLALAALASARAQLVVGNDQAGTATIYNINVTTGVATPIYSSAGNEAKPWGMAFDNRSNTLYWNNGNTLYSSPFGATLSPTTVGTFTFNGVGVNFVGLAFANGFLYGTRNIATEAVYQIDPVTLVATQVYVYPSTYDIGGLDYDTASGIFYGLTDAAPAPGTAGLYQLDLAAQSITFRAPYPVGETDIDGLAVYNGRAYYVSDGPNTAQANFYVYDIATGAQIGTLPSPFTGSGTFSAATYIAPIPEPSSLALLAMAVLSAGLIKARRARALRRSAE